MATPEYFAQRSPVIRTKSGLSGQDLRAGTPGSPHTPTLGRSVSSQFGSPGAYRTDEDFIVYEVGSRFLRAGVAGESSPRCILKFGPDQSRRVGDFAGLHGSYGQSHDPHANDRARDHELWRLDVRDPNIALVEDKLERAMRTVHGKYLMIDSKTRKALVAVPSLLPHHLLELTLRAIFAGPHQPPSAVILPNSILNAIAAGLRSALVIDIGWYETTITAVYEYREVSQRRTDRAGKLLCEEMSSMLLQPRTPGTNRPATAQAQQGMSFAFVEDIVTRVAWCNDTMTSSSNGTEDVGEVSPSNLTIDCGSQIKVPFSMFSLPAERVFFGSHEQTRHIEDNHLSLPELAWRCLLALPLDVRAVCMSRITITGGPSNMPGLKCRLLKEIDLLISARGCDRVLSYGSAAEAKRSKTAVQEERRRKSGAVADAPSSSGSDDKAKDAVLPPSKMPQEDDEISQKLARNAAKDAEPPLKAVVRGIETLGAWAGASIVSNLRIDGVAEIKREDFMKHGLIPLGNTI